MPEDSQGDTLLRSVGWDKDFITNVDRDVFDSYALRYVTLQALGYKVEIRDKATDTYGRRMESYIAVHVPDNAENTRVRALTSAALDETTLDLMLRDVEEGKSSQLLKLAQGKDDEYNNSMRTLISRRQDIPQQLAQRFFMCSYERALEVKNKRENENRYFFGSISDEARAEYNRLVAQGITPISVQEVAALVATQMRSVLEKKPELRPTNYRDPGDLGFPVLEDSPPEKQQKSRF